MCWHRSKCSGRAHNTLIVHDANIFNDSHLYARLWIYNRWQKHIGYAHELQVANGIRSLTCMAHEMVACFRTIPMSHERMKASQRWTCLPIFDQVHSVDWEYAQSTDCPLPSHLSHAPHIHWSMFSHMDVSKFHSFIIDDVRGVWMWSATVHKPYASVCLGGRCECDMLRVWGVNPSISMFHT